MQMIKEWCLTKQFANSNVENSRKVLKLLTSSWIGKHTERNNFQMNKRVITNKEYNYLRFSMFYQIKSNMIFTNSVE